MSSGIGSGTHVSRASDPDQISVELSARRTGMSFQRTRMSADRTLMSVIRTSLSLISFGFTIHKVFQGLKDSGAIEHAASGRNFGVALVLLGVVMLLIGIGYHAWFMLALRKQRNTMTEGGLVYGESPFPPSMTLITAILLFILGIVAFASMTLNIGPFE